MMERGILVDDVINALIHGEIIEQYPADYPYPSCLVLGLTLKETLLHIVCGIGDDVLWLITAYYPDPSKWSEDFKTRKENR
jgi:hypothetical protein